MAELYDPKRALTEDWRTFFFENYDRMFILPCEDKDVEIQGNWMVVNIMLCMPLIKRFRPIHSKHLYLEGLFTSSTQSKHLDLVSRTLEEYGYTREEIGHDIMASKMDAHNMVYTHLGEWHDTMDIDSISKTILQEEAESICSIDYGDIDDGDIIRMEGVFKEQSKRVIELLSSDELPFNIFRAPLVCGALKVGQFAQFVLSGGPRTDTDEDIFRRPVVGSFLGGMRDILDIAIESRSAAKATFYNKTQMPTTQYNNRKNHLQNSAMWHLYPGDCGSTVYMTYRLTEKIAKHFLGKFFVGGNGELIELTKKQYPLVLDKDIKFRSVITCRYLDGYCETCGGTITRSFSKFGNVGFVSNVNTGAPVAQQVLSTKHLISTDALEYEVPSELSNVLMSTSNTILLKRSVHRHIDKLAFGFSPNDVAKINDLQYHLPENDLRASYFSDIKKLSIGVMQPDGRIKRDVPSSNMGGDTKSYPHLSPEILAVIQKHPEDWIIQDQIAWFLLRNINPIEPVMQCTVVNNSIRKYVDDFSNLVTKHAERYTSAEVFMRDLMHLIWQRVDPHVTHIECLARCCMVTSKKDFHVPVVDDVNNVMFGNLMRNIPGRSIGAQFAFERYSQITNKPITYITGKRHGILDEYMGYTDIIQRDMHWPAGSDRLTLEGV